LLRGAWRLVRCALATLHRIETCFALPTDFANVGMLLIAT